nr:dTDP-4-dehydrorhamnose 3,5-epimerase family protein [Defluviicoccus vanus]
MNFEATPIEGLCVLRATQHADERGHFARLWDETEFTDAGLGFRPTQISTSFNRQRGTLRGMHWQVAPHAETKLVRPVRGRIFDVAVDLRRQSRHWGHGSGSNSTPARAPACSSQRSSRTDF